MTLGEKIKKVRKDNNLTQEAFANEILVSRRSVSDWEQDKFTPQMNNLLEICKKFNVKMNYFIEDYEVEEVKAVEKSKNVIGYINGIKNYKPILVYNKDIKKMYKGLVNKKISNIIFIIIYVLNLFLFLFCFPLGIIGFLIIGLVNYFVNEYLFNLYLKRVKALGYAKHQLMIEYPIYYEMEEDFNLYILNELQISVKKDDIKGIFISPRSFKLRVIEAEIHTNEAIQKLYLITPNKHSFNHTLNELNIIKQIFKK